MGGTAAAQQTGAPAATPISVAELKTHLRLDGLTSVDQDAMFGLYIQGVVRMVERRYGIALVTQTWTAVLDYGFDGCHFTADWGGRPYRAYDEIQLPAAPLQSVDSITYVDNNGTVQTLGVETYQLDTLSRPGRVLKAYGAVWPAVRPQRQAVTIQYKAGFGTPAAVPADIKHALKLICGAWQANAEEVITGMIIGTLPWGAEALLSTYKIHTFG